MIKTRKEFVFILSPHPVRIPDSLFCGSIMGSNYLFLHRQIRSDC